ncbi:MAG TPA: polysaccharide biosynthesis tyrosine autokinase [bacterium]|nr:polysaccharide biosynthesis tyrosine autokinase [bacterium]
MEVWKYYRVLRRWRWVIVAAMIAGVLGGLAFYRPGIHDYSATAILLVPSADSAAFSTHQTQGPGQTRGLAVLGRIWSSDIAERVIQDLHMNESVYGFHLRLAAAQDKDNPLIHIAVSGRTPREAIALANAVADTVAQDDRDAGQRDFTVARELVERQLTTAQAQEQALQAQLLAFERANQADLSSPALVQITSLQTQLQDNDVALREVQARLTSTNAQLQQQGPTRTERELTTNPQTESIRTQLLNAEISLTGELAYHTESHPHVIALKKQIDGLKAQLAAALTQAENARQIVHNALYDSLTAARINLVTDEMALEAKRDAWQQVIAATARQLPVVAQKKAQQAGYSRAIGDLDRMIQSLTQQVSDARLREQAAQAQANVSVVDRAQSAQANPFRAEGFVLMFALMLGLLLGVGLAGLLEYLDNTVKTPQRAEGILGVPNLAAIPSHNPPFNEAYRMLRVNLTALEHDKPEIFAFTGVKPGVGTSTVVANTARAFARAGRRTIVVDAAVERPVLHSRFGVPNDIGLADVLNARATLAEALVPTGVRNLEVLPAGTVAADEGAVDGRFGSTAMRDLLTALHGRADVVLFDTSPASIFSATLDLAPLMSGVILAIDARQVPRGLELQAKTQLTRVGASLLGMVLTRMRPDLVDSYYYYDRQLKPQRPGLSPAMAATGLAVLIGAAGLVAALLLRRAGLHLPAFGEVLVRWAPFLHFGVFGGR